ncbi:MAG: prepilin peptidase [Verrucomicrobia bacterium]|nr:prepilin peptidase [Verrucomicrobiota bacterium]
MFEDFQSTFPWYIFFALVSFFFGASFGSFLNVCIYRIPRELSVVKPRSFCPHCNKQIAWFHNIPILSFFLLRAKCAYCSAPISPRYVLVETLTAFLFLLIWMKFDLHWGHRPFGLSPITDWRIVPVYWLAVFGLILGTFVDFEFMIIPDRVTLGGIVAGLVISPFIPQLHGPTVTTWTASLFQSALGAGIGWSMLWTVSLIGKMIFRKDAMGFGDVKLIGAIGAFLGWKAVLFTVMLSSLFGSIVGITLVATGRKEMQSRIPYGPYLALAAIVWILWGPEIWSAYINFVTPARATF